MTAPAVSIRTVAGLLRERARGTRSEDVAIRFLEAGQWIEWTWAAYWAAAESAASGFLEAGVQPGDHVLMLTPEARANVTALFGLWTIGAVPVQIGLPFQLHNRAEFMGNLAETARRLGARFLLTTPELAPLVQGDVRVLVTTLMPEGALEVPDPEAADGLAFIQLTSGSTSAPRGVMVPHDRLMLHLRAMSEALPSHADSVAVSWLPLHHDMGLLGGLLFPFYNGFRANMISTADFQARPGVWLETMSRFRATIAAAPPSAFAICLQLAPRLLSRGIDLSAWECAMVGAEPISSTLLDRFAEAFASTGFRKQAFFPVYGLAEATVAVTFPVLLDEPKYDRVDRLAIEHESVALPQSDAESSLVFVGVGKPIPGTNVSIVNHHGETLPDRHIGEVCVCSKSLSLGYYDEPHETAATFGRGGWLRTGDLGYQVDDELFITGRRKEIIIKGGQNLIPSVLEEIVAAVPGVRTVAAVGVHSAERSTELVCIAAETRLEPAHHPDLTEKIREGLQARGAAVDKVVLFAPKSLPKTTSGKVKRVAIARLLAERFGY